MVWNWVTGHVGHGSQNVTHCQLWSGHPRHPQWLFHWLSVPDLVTRSCTWNALMMAPWENVVFWIPAGRWWACVIIAIAACYYYRTTCTWQSTASGIEKQQLLLLLMHESHVCNMSNKCWAWSWYLWAWPVADSQHCCYVTQWPNNPTHYSGGTQTEV